MCRPRHALRWFIAGAVAAVMIQAGPVGAQWSSDPYENLALADRTSEQVTPKIASTADGGCYVVWFDLASGTYDVYLQRLDAGGYEQWAHNGLLVSDHPQNSSLVDWDLMADSEGNAIVVFTDARNGSDLDVYAYKVAPDGTLLWGPDGVTLSTNADFEPAPVVTEASDGDLIVVWARLPDAGDGTLQMQRLSPEGVERYPHGGLSIVAPSGESPAFCSVVPSLDGSVIVCWVRDISSYFSPRHVRAERFAGDGGSVWGAPVSVFDAYSVPIAYSPKLEPDGSGGAVVLWHRSDGSLYNSFVQRLDAEGAELFPHNGVAVSTRPNFYHIDPALAFHPDTGESFVFWDERTTNQNQWGIYGQKISATGTRAWGDQGVSYLPVSTLYKWAIRTVPSGDGAMVFYLDEPTGTYDQNRVMGFRVDAAGTPTWTGWPIEVSALLSGKSRLPVTIGLDGVAKMVWEDDRNGTIDLYGQNVNLDGSLGTGSAGLPDDLGTSPVRFLPSRPNPFRTETELRFLASGGTAATVVIADAAGRVVRRLLAPADAASSGGIRDAREVRLIWDGRDEGGRRVPAGVYLCRLEGDGTEPGRQRVVAVR